MQKVEKPLQSIIYRLEAVIKESEIQLNNRKEELFYLNKQFKEEIEKCRKSGIKKINAGKV